ncbi:MAG: peptide chain release factor N(5)-glutamine methyltransferase [Giesbergeria sp.]
MISIAITVASALSTAQAHGLARIDAQLLLLHLLGREDVGRAWLIAHGDEALEPAQATHFADLCLRRVAGEPVAYLTGHKPFHGLDLHIDKRVLDPRPDTETLVDWALELLADQPAPRVLDLGTGSGAIALAIAHARPNAKVCAVDASADALDVARANAKRLRLPVGFTLSDWFAHVDGSYQLIVSNPPYIAEADPHLPALRHEPLSALVAGEDGLRDLRSIIDAAPQHLSPGGWLLLEHGWDQAETVQHLLRSAGFAHTQTRNDLAGIGRCSGGQWPRVK